MMFLFQSGNMWIFLCDGQPPAGLPSQELGPSRLVPSWFWTGAQRNQIHHDKEDHHHDHQESTGSVCVDAYGTVIIITKHETWCTICMTSVQRPRFCWSMCSCAPAAQ